MGARDKIQQAKAQQAATVQLQEATLHAALATRTELMNGHNSVASTDTITMSNPTLLYDRELQYDTLGHVVVPLLPKLVDQKVEQLEQQTMTVEQEVAQLEALCSKYQLWLQQAQGDTSSQEQQQEEHGGVSDAPSSSVGGGAGASSSMVAPLN